MNTPQPRSLYRDLTLALVLLVATVSVLVAVANYFISSRDFDARYKSRGEEYTAHLQRSLELPLWNVDDELIKSIGNIYSANADIARIVIRDENQRVIYRHETRNGSTGYQFPVRHEGQTIGSVEIGLSLKQREESQSQLIWNSLMTVALLIIMLAAAVGWLLTRLLGKPLATLHTVIADVVAGKYQLHSLPETSQEFAPILASLKQMADVVANREQSLTENNLRLAEEIAERKQAEQALRLNEERLKLATGSGHVGVWDWDIAHNILVWDSSMYTLYGIAEDDFGGAYEAWSSTLHPDDRQATEQEVQAALRGEREYAPEFRIVRPGGEIRNIKATSQTSFNEQGQAIRMIGVNFDITEAKRIEAELRQYKDHLEDEVGQRTEALVLARKAAEAANQAKSVFLANMSHELRTPLNAILGFSNLLRKDATLQDNQRDTLDIINRSGEHLLTLINDVLEMAKIEAGRVQIAHEPFDLGGMVRDVTDMMQVRAHEKGLSLQIDQSSRFPRYIKGDEARLRQVLINLIGNAVKFTRHGGVRVSLNVKENHVSHLLIEIEDSGIGISDADQQRIFEPFVQLGEDASQKGTGLGLTISRQFIQLMGGELTLTSAVGAGSTFRVDLPVEKMDAADLSQPDVQIQGEVIALKPGQPEYRILIVEDQTENQMLLRQLMERIGLTVKVAANGVEGVALFQSWQPHLIWMDRRMPVLDGMEATRQIRRLPEGDRVKIVAVTASAMLEQRDEMLAIGMNDFVRKPYRSNEIYECLSRQLGVRFIYASDEKPATDEIELTSAMLDDLSAEAKAELVAVLESLDAEQISAAVHRLVPRGTNLHKSLIYLVENFNYPAILRALQQ